MTAATRGGRSGPVVVIGLGYVGLPLAVAAAEAGHQVVGFDHDAERIESLRNRRSYVDDVADDDLDRIAADDRFRVTDDVATIGEAPMVIITVPTPLVDGAPDLSAVESASEQAGRVVARGGLVVLESTSYPGTTEEVVAPIVERRSGLVVGRDLLLAYSPERIDPGNTTWTLANTPKLVAGADAASLEAAQAFYDTIVGTTVAVSGTREAEMAKLLENTYRHVNIALVNELAISARALGIDIEEVVRAAATKPFGFMKFTPGPGVGGHCLPVDPVYLSWRFESKLGSPTRFIEVANDINRSMADYVVRRVTLGLNERQQAVNGARLLVIGVAYKKNTGDARESPATPILEQLVSLGALIDIHDPWVRDYQLDGLVGRIDDLHAVALDAYDGIIVCADHDGIDYELIAAADCFVFDTRYRLRGPNVETL